MMNASHDLTDHVDRARLVESCGARDDSPSWNLGRAKQGDTTREDGTSPRGRGQEDVKESDKVCFRVQVGQVQGQVVVREVQSADPSSLGRARQYARPRRTTRLPGNEREF